MPPLQDFLGNEYSRRSRMAFRWWHRFGVAGHCAAAVCPVAMRRKHLSLPYRAAIVSTVAGTAPKIIVDRYTDDAVGYLEQREDGRSAMTRVVLRPRCEYAGSPPDPDVIQALHHKAHELCFIANSVTSEIVTEIVSSEKDKTGATPMHQEVKPPLHSAQAGDHS